MSNYVLDLKKHFIMACDKMPKFKALPLPINGAKLGGYTLSERAKRAHVSNSRQGFETGNEAAPSRS